MVSEATGPEGEAAGPRSEEPDKIPSQRQIKSGFWIHPVFPQECFFYVMQITLFPGNKSKVQMNVVPHKSWIGGQRGCQKPGC